MHASLPEAAMGRAEHGAAAVGLAAVTKRFPGVVAVDGVTLDVRAGEVHVLLGENGAGKSTIVGMLAGLQAPDAGSVTVGGRPVRLASPSDALTAGISTVFQHVMLVPTLSVFENLVLGGAWWRRPPRTEIEARLAGLRREFGLDVPLDAAAGELSLGQQQQIEIARALLRDSRVLILDEATSMLAPQGADQLGGLMRRLASRGLAVIFITHKLGEAHRFGDRVSVLRQGRLAGELGPERLRSFDPAGAADAMVRLMFGATGGAASPAAGRTRPLAGDRPVRLEVAGLAAEGGSTGAVRDIDLVLREGEILGVAGIDGNGQKQLAEALAGQRPAAAGRITLDGADLTRASVAERRRRGLRYLTDDRLAEGSVGDFPIAANMVLKEIGAPPFWTGGFERPARIGAHARELIARYSVHTPSETTPIGRLSGGNIQKLLLARELSGEARAVVFNKPTYGLDTQNTVASRRRIRDIAGRGIAVLLISTDLDELIELCDRIAVMAGGRIAGTLANDPDAAGEMRMRIGRLMVGGAPA